MSRPPTSHQAWHWNLSPRSAAEAEGCAACGERRLWTAGPGCVEGAGVWGGAVWPFLHVHGEHSGSLQPLGLSMGLPAPGEEAAGLQGPVRAGLGACRALPPLPVGACPTCPPAAAPPWSATAYVMWGVGCASSTPWGGQVWGTALRPHTPSAGWCPHGSLHLPEPQFPPPPMGRQPAHWAAPRSAETMCVGAGGCGDPRVVFLQEK